jgi:hypothetical protein
MSEDILVERGVFGTFGRFDKLAGAFSNLPWAWNIVAVPLPSQSLAFSQ